jgi:hypothetical protein
MSDALDREAKETWMQVRRRAQRAEEERDEYERLYGMAERALAEAHAECDSIRTEVLEEERLRRVVGRIDDRREIRKEVLRVADKLREAGLENQRFYNAEKTSDPHLRGQYVGMHHAYVGAADEILAALATLSEDGDEPGQAPRWKVGQILRHPSGGAWELIEHFDGKEHDDWLARRTESMHLGGGGIGETKIFHREYMDRTFSVAARPDCTQPVAEEQQDRGVER